MPKVILVLLCLLSLPARALTPEEQKIEQVEALIFQYHRTVDPNQKQLREIFQSLDRQQMPRAWIRAYQYLYTELGDHLSPAEFKDLEASIEASHDIGSLVY